MKLVITFLIAVLIFGKSIFACEYCGHNLFIEITENIGELAYGEELNICRIYPHCTRGPTIKYTLRKKSDPRWLGMGENYGNGQRLFEMYFSKDPELLSQDEKLELGPAPQPKFLKKLGSIDEISWNFSDSILPLKTLAAKAVAEHEIRTQRCFGDDLAKWFPKLKSVINLFYYVDSNFSSLPICYEEYIRRAPWENVPLFVYYYTQVQNSEAEHAGNILEEATNSGKASAATKAQNIYIRRIYRLSKDKQKTLMLMENLRNEIRQILSEGKDVYLPKSQTPFQGTDFVQIFYK